MRRLALSLIRFLPASPSPQRLLLCLSTHTGRQSCSALGYRAVRRFGVIGGVRGAAGTNAPVRRGPSAFFIAAAVTAARQRACATWAVICPCDGSRHLPSCDACNSARTRWNVRAGWPIAAAVVATGRERTRGSARRRQGSTFRPSAIPAAGGVALSLARFLCPPRRYRHPRPPQKPGCPSADPSNRPFPRRCDSRRRS